MDWLQARALENSLKKSEPQHNHYVMHTWEDIDGTPHMTGGYEVRSYKPGSREPFKTRKEDK